MRRLHRSVLLGIALGTLAHAQSGLPVKWEELTATDFPKAIEKAQGTCVLPFGVLEKHGPHLPLGTDVINSRWAAVHATAQEYAVVFPEYYFGQIFEAKHEPGTVAYSPQLQLQLLQETANEMSRNGCKKIVIVNGHGGNNNLLPFFAQSQLASPHDYVVYVCSSPRERLPGRPALKSKYESHAGEAETSAVMASRPDLVRMDYVKGESGDRKRLDLPEGVYTGIWWYARFPEHYAGDASPANKALGEFDLKAWANHVAAVLRAVKADRTSLDLQKEFYEKASRPLETAQ